MSSICSTGRNVPLSNPPTKIKFFDLQNLSLILLLWDIFLGLPISYLLTQTNKTIITYLGYEKIMRCPSGIFFNRSLFVVVNMILVISWATQLVKEERVKRERWEREEIKRLDGVIAWLEALKKEAEMDDKRKAESLVGVHAKLGLRAFGHCIRKPGFSDERMGNSGSGF